MVKILYSAHGLQIKQKNALITNTYGTGYYRIQDIDGDGKLDEEEANNEQSPYIGVPKITAPYEGDNKVKAVVHFNENAGKGNKAQLINKTELSLLQLIM